MPLSKRQPVESTSLASVGYEPASETLEVEFRTGTQYRFFQVPFAVYEELRAAESKGRFFLRKVRDQFPYARVPDQSQQVWMRMAPDPPHDQTGGVATNCKSRVGMLPRYRIRCSATYVMAKLRSNPYLPSDSNRSATFKSCRQMCCTSSACTC